MVRGLNKGFKEGGSWIALKRIAQGDHSVKGLLCACEVHWLGYLIARRGRVLDTLFCFFSTEEIWRREVRVTWFGSRDGSKSVFFVGGISEQPEATWRALHAADSRLYHGPESKQSFSCSKDNLKAPRRRPCHQC